MKNKSKMSESELRDWFAGISLPEVIRLESSRVKRGKAGAETIVKGAYSIADAMLVQRKRKSVTLTEFKMENVLENQ